MSQYSRTQEDRAADKLIKAGFELVQDTGRTTTHKGDKHMMHPDVGLHLIIDNKSTRGKEQINLKRKDLEKIRKEAKGLGVGAITITFLNSPNVYIVFNIDDLEGVIY